MRALPLWAIEGTHYATAAHTAQAERR